eukprot:3932677-Rhodomonas_salina.2
MAPRYNDHLIPKLKGEATGGRWSEMGGCWGLGGPETGSWCPDVAGRGGGGQEVVKNDTRYGSLI